MVFQHCFIMNLHLYVFFSCQTEDTLLITRQSTQDDLDALDLTELDGAQFCQNRDVLTE